MPRGMGSDPADRIINLGAGEVPDLPHGGPGPSSLEGLLERSRSAWGTQCVQADFPSQEEVVDFLDEGSDRWEAFVVGSYRLGGLSAGSAQNWAGELTDVESAKVSAALEVLTCAKSSIVLDRIKDEVAGTFLVEEALRRVLDLLAEHATGPLIGKNNGENPMFKLLFGDSSFRVSQLVTSGLSVPDSFVFPLNWHDGLILEEDADPVALPEETRDGLAEAAAAVGGIQVDSLPSFDDVMETLSSTGILAPGLAFAVIPAWLTATQNQVFVNLLIEDQDDLLDEIAADIQDAADATQVNDSIAALIDAMHTALDPLGDVATRRLLPFAETLEWLGVLPDLSESIRSTVDLLNEGINQFVFGLSLDEIAYVRRSLLTDPQTESGTGMAGVSQPVVQLGDAVLAFYYDDYSNAYDPVPDTGQAWPNDWAYTYEGRSFTNTWLHRANPTLQFAFTLDLASEVLAQMLNAENAFFALSGAASADGPTGSAIRGLLVDRGYECLTEILGGVSFSKLLSYIYRQAMTDLFLGTWEGHNGGSFADDCVLELFCWMRTEERRELIDLVLGEREAGELTRDFAGGALAALFSRGLGHLRGVGRAPLRVSRRDPALRRRAGLCRPRVRRGRARLHGGRARGRGRRISLRSDRDERGLGRDRPGAGWPQVLARSARAPVRPLDLAGRLHQGAPQRGRVGPARRRWRRRAKREDDVVRVSAIRGLAHGAIATGPLLLLVACTDTKDSSAPAPDEEVWVSSLPGPWTQLSAGGGSACALDVDGRGTCWGGAGSPPEELRFLTISVHGHTACGVTSDDELTCWEEDDAYVHFPDLEGVASVSVSLAGACALMQDGGTSCWLESGDEVDAPGETFEALDVGSDSGCGLLPDGSLSCWSWDAALQVVPDDAPAGTFTEVAVGGPWNAAIDTEGLLVWGPEEQRIEGPIESVDIDDQYDSFCYISEGVVSCLERPDTDVGDFAPMTRQFAGAEYSSVAVSLNFVCALGATAELLCVGDALNTPLF